MSSSVGFRPPPLGNAGDTGNEDSCHTSITPPPFQLVRTTTMSIKSFTSIYGVHRSAPRATLQIGDLNSMVENWTADERVKKRRIVQFKGSLKENELSTFFKALSPSEQPQYPISINCILWEKKDENDQFFVTLVELLALFEQLAGHLCHPSENGLLRTNRMRNSLDKVQSKSISKDDPETSEFWKLIKSFNDSKPLRTKNIKVFNWQILGHALETIISQYTVVPSANLQPRMPASSEGWDVYPRCDPSASTQTDGWA